MKKKLFLFVLLFTFIFCGSTFGATLMFQVDDQVNDLATINEYQIFSKQQSETYPDTASVSATPETPDFAITLTDGDCYTLSVIVVDDAGRPSDRGAELTVCLDASGNPTFPDGPSPANLIFLGIQ